MLQSSSQISNLPGEIHNPFNSRLGHQMRSHISILEATCLELYCKWTFCILGPLLPATVQGYSKRRSSSFSSAKRLAGSLSSPAALRSSRSWSDFSFKTFFFSWIFLSLWREMQLYLWSKYVFIQQVSNYTIQLGFDKATWKSSTGNKNSVTKYQIWQNGRKKKGFYC